MNEQEPKQHTPIIKLQILGKVIWVDSNPNTKTQLQYFNSFYAHQFVKYHSFEEAAPYCQSNPHHPILFLVSSKKVTEYIQIKNKYPNILKKCLVFCGGPNTARSTFIQYKQHIAYVSFEISQVINAITKVQGYYDNHQYAQQLNSNIKAPPKKPAEDDKKKQPQKEPFGKKKQQKVSKTSKPSSPINTNIKRLKIQIQGKHMIISIYKNFFVCWIYDFEQQQSRCPYEVKKCFEESDIGVNEWTLEEVKDVHEYCWQNKKYMVLMSGQNFKFQELLNGQMQMVLGFFKLSQSFSINHIDIEKQLLDEQDIKVIYNLKKLKNQVLEITQEI